MFNFVRPLKVKELRAEAEDCEQERRCLSVKVAPELQAGGMKPEAASPNWLLQRGLCQVMITLNYCVVWRLSYELKHSQSCDFTRLFVTGSCNSAQRASCAYGHVAGDNQQTARGGIQCNVSSHIHTLPQFWCLDV